MYFGLVGPAQPHGKCEPRVRDLAILEDSRRTRAGAFWRPEVRRLHAIRGSAFVAPMAFGGPHTRGAKRRTLEKRPCVPQQNPFPPDGSCTERIDDGDERAE